MASLIRPSDWKHEAGQTADMERAVALSRDTVGSEGLYTSVVTTAPGGATRIHHHGPCETSIYVVAGSARFTFGPTGVENGFDAQAGDIVYIPAREPHVEANPSDSEPLVVLLTRNCPAGVNIYLDP